MPSTPRWIVRPRPVPRARKRLFCFPYAGGGASVFRRWPENVPHVEVCAVQLPGREDRIREALFHQMDPLVDALIPALQPFMDRPFALFGHSMGGLIAFEVARRLAGFGGLERVFVSGMAVPRTPHSDPWHKLPESDFIVRVRQLGGLPDYAAANSELLNLVLPILRADFELSETYTVEAAEPLSCPMAAYAGAGDVRARPDAVRAWSPYTRQQFVFRVFPGAHNFVESSRAAVVNHIASVLTPSAVE